MANLRNRLLFKKGDPLRDLHVPKRERTALDPEPIEDPGEPPVDAAAVRADTEVVPPDQLQ